MDKQGSSFYKVIEAVRQHDFELAKIPKTGQNTMHFLKLKSNSLRNTGLLVDGTIPLTFDGEGFAYVKPSDKSAIEALMMARPGRFSFVDEPQVIVTPVIVVEEEDPITVELREALALEAPDNSDPLEILPKEEYAELPATVKLKGRPKGRKN